MDVGLTELEFEGDSFLVDGLPLALECGDLGAKLLGEGGGAVEGALDFLFSLAERVYP
jgi:hypothetical protein